MSYSELAGLVRLVGRARTIELLLEGREGRVVDAGEAMATALMQRVVDDAAVTAAACESARRIAAAAPLVARWYEKLMNRLEAPRPLDDEERDEAFPCVGSGHFREGYRAFLDRCEPRFRGL